MPGPLALGFPRPIMILCVLSEVKEHAVQHKIAGWLYLLELSILILLIHSSLISHLFHNVSSIPSPTFSLFLRFLFPPRSSLSSFLSSLFPLLSRIYNVPCLDFNGMCSRETPVVIHNPVPWKFSEEMPRRLSFTMQHYLLNFLDSCTHSETNMAKNDKKPQTR